MTDMTDPDFTFVDHDVQPEAWCPYCRAIFDGAMNATGEDAPGPGDPSICFYCAGISVFVERGHLDLPTEQQLIEFVADDRVVLLIVTINKFLDDHPDIDRRSMVDD